MQSRGNGVVAGNIAGFVLGAVAVALLVVAGLAAFTLTRRPHARQHPAASQTEQPTLPTNTERDSPSAKSSAPEVGLVWQSLSAG